MKKTIIICATAIICIILICLTIVFVSKGSRYVNFNGIDRAVLDKRTGKVTVYSSGGFSELDFPNKSIKK